MSNKKEEKDMAVADEAKEPVKPVVDVPKEAKQKVALSKEEALGPKKKDGKETTLDLGKYLTMIGVRPIERSAREAHAARKLSIPFGRKIPNRIKSSWDDVFKDF